MKKVNYVEIDTCPKCYAGKFKVTEGDLINAEGVIACEYCGFMCQPVFSAYKYKLTVKHDNGKVKLIAVARSAYSAIQMICNAENCPESAIVKVYRYVKPVYISE